MSGHPLISVIMPAYNAAAYIGEAIASVLAQSHAHWELIIIDDASTDATGDIAQGFNDARIRYQRIPATRSNYRVRNIGLAQATGDFIAFLDADDVYLPDSLHQRVAILQENPRLTVLYGFAQYMDEAGRPVPQNITLIPQADGGYELPPYICKTWPDVVMGNLPCLLPALMLRRATLERVGVFNEALSSTGDYEYFLRLFLDDFDGVACWPNYAYRYRIHAASLTKGRAQAEQVLANSLGILDWLFQQPGLPPDCQALRSRAYTERYRYQGRLRLTQGQPDITRHFVQAAFQDRRVARRDACRILLPLVFRSLLPAGFDAQLRRLRWRLRNPHLLSTRHG